MPTWVGYVRDARSVAHRRLIDAATACDGADVIVASNLAQVLGWQMSDHLGVPLVRTLFHAPTYWMARSGSSMAGAARELAWLAARPWLNSVRCEALALPPVPVREPIGELNRRGMPILYPFSPLVFPPPAHGGATVAVTGYWFLDASLDPEPPRELIAFLEDGPPPVCIGFGTQIDDDPTRTTTIMVEALRRAGRRGILLRTPQAIKGIDLPPAIRAVAAVSHTWLLPRCAAMVHHCAAGTTAAALRAGVPAVPVPHNSDQFSWARRVSELGVGSRPIPRRRLSVQSLEEAIRMVTGNGDVRRRAADLGAAIRQEDGVARAVEFFERYVGGRGGRAPAQAVNSAPEGLPA
jgi:UDP:flavonoid glycosyltransferase YjiC (YdhE family)